MIQWKCPKKPLQNSHQGLALKSGMHAVCDPVQNFACQYEENSPAGEQETKCACHIAQWKPSLYIGVEFLELISLTSVLLLSVCVCPSCSELSFQLCNANLSALISFLVFFLLLFLAEMSTCWLIDFFFFITTINAIECSFSQQTYKFSRDHIERSVGLVGSLACDVWFWQSGHPLVRILAETFHFVCC